MSQKPLLPSGRQRGLPFVVPDDWNPNRDRCQRELQLDELMLTA
ncbi:MAG TPA: hypothetical protein VNZ04_13535 [Trinickia sp.]|jgi:hypothetical protein|nr:hypothetical protein [Trinickia sp.]